ncbi:MAG: hypothetical protein RIC11_13190 [Botrimarina sp.]
MPESAGGESYASRNSPAAVRPSGEPTPPKREEATTDYAELFAVIVAGAKLPSPEGLEDAALEAAAEALEGFDEAESLGYIRFLRGRLSDPSPWVRATAAREIAWHRDKLNLSAENRDLIEVFAELLRHENRWVRKLALIDVDSVIGDMPFGDDAQPLVAALAACLEDSETQYLPILYLGRLGPDASEALPAIREASERTDHAVISEAAEEAIQRIEGRTE